MTARALFHNAIALRQVRYTSLLKRHFHAICISCRYKKLDEMIFHSLRATASPKFTFYYRMSFSGTVGQLTQLIMLGISRSTLPQDIYAEIEKSSCAPHVLLHLISLLVYFLYFDNIKGKSAMSPRYRRATAT